MLLLGEVGEQAGGAGEDRDRLHRVRREAELEHHGRDRHRDVHGQRLAPDLGRPVAQASRERHVGAADAPHVRELEDPLGARVHRTVNRMTESRQPAAGGVDRPRHAPGR